MIAKKDISIFSPISMSISDAHYITARAHLQNDNLTAAKSSIIESLEKIGPDDKVKQWEKIFFQCLVTKNEKVNTELAQELELNIKQNDINNPHAWKALAYAQHKNVRETSWIKAYDKAYALINTNHLSEADEFFVSEYLQALMSQFRIPEARDVFEKFTGTTLGLDYEKEVFDVVLKYKELQNPDIKTLQALKESIVLIKDEYSNTSNGFTEMLQKTYFSVCLALHDYSSIIHNYSQNSSAQNKHRFDFLQAQAFIESGQNISKGEYILGRLKQWIGNQLPNSEEEWLRVRPNDFQWQYFLAYAYLLQDKIEEKERIFIEDIAQKAVDQNITQEPLHLFIQLKVADRADRDNINYDIAKWYADRQLDTKAIPYFATVDRSNNYPDKYFSQRYAHSLYYDSPTTVPPFNDISKINLAINLIERTDNATFAEEDKYWYPNLEGFIYEVASNLDTTSRLSYQWKAIWLAEQAHIIKDNYYTTACLARFYRNAGLLWHAEQYAAKAVQLNGEEALPKEELLICQLDLGNWREANDRLNKLIAEDPKNYSYLSWLGFIDFHLQDYDAAIARFSSLSEKESNDLWVQSMLMLSYWHHENIVESKNIAESILATQHTILAQNNPYAIGWSYLVLQKIDEAKKMFSFLNRIEGERPHAKIELFYIAFVQNDEPQMNQLFQEIKTHCTYPRHLKEMSKTLNKLENIYGFSAQGWINEIRKYLNHTEDQVKLLDLELTYFKSKNSLTQYHSSSFTLQEIRHQKQAGQVGDALQKYIGLTPFELPKAFQEKAIQKLLQTKKYDQVVTQPKSVEIEMSADILPDGQSSEWALINNDIPNLRKQMLDDLGWEIPGVNFKDNHQWSNGRYAIHINQINMYVGDAEKHKYSDMLTQLRLTITKHLPQLVTLESMRRYYHINGIEEFELSAQKIAMVELFKLLLAHEISVGNSKTILSSLIKIDKWWTKSSEDLYWLVRPFILTGLPMYRKQLSVLQMPAELESEMLEYLIIEKEYSFLSIPSQKLSAMTQKISDFIQKHRDETSSTQKALMIKSQPLLIPLQHFLHLVSLPVSIVLENEMKDV